MIDVEQEPLRPFEQDAGPRAAHGLQPLPRRLRELQHRRRDLAQRFEQLGPVHRVPAEPGTKRVMMRAQPVELRVQPVEIAQVANANGAAPDLVLVGRTDASPRRADLAGARRVLAHSVEVAVNGQDQRAIVGDGEIVRSDLDALPLELGDLVAQRPRIEHDAVTDDGQCARNNSGGKERQLVRRAVHDQRVAGIVPSLETDDGIGFLRQPVDDLALAFVAPLSADYGDVGHMGSAFLQRFTNAPGVRRMDATAQGVCPET